MKTQNVLLFITDGHRTDALGCYGSRLGQTPHMDAFAREGVLFERSFCTHSVCMPTRASIFTGRYPHVHGVWANGVTLPTSEVTLPQVLAERGYATCATGKVHFEPQQAYTDRLAPIIPSDKPYYGFQEVHLSENSLGKEYLRFIEKEHPSLLARARKRDRLPEEAHDLHWITSQAIDFIQRQGSAGRPFFCACSFHELSPPCTPPEGFAGRFKPEDMPVPELREDDLAKKPPFYRQCYEGYVKLKRQPDDPTLRKWLASYYDQQRFLDKQFGRVLSALKELGLWDNTLVLFTADHGLSLNDHWQWRHGPFVFDQVINVPMIWHVPGMKKPCEGSEPSQGLGSRCAEMVESVDILPTVLEWCGVPCPPGVQGRSLRPLLFAEPGARGKESVLVQERQAPDLAARGLDPNSVTQFGVRTSDWKLIHYPGCPYGELYNLQNDPGEFDNLWADPGYHAKRADLERLLLDRLLDSQDPLPVRHYEW